MIREVGTNKILEDQLDKINRVHKINSINMKKVQVHLLESASPDLVLQDFQIEQATMQLRIINGNILRRK